MLFGEKYPDPVRMVSMGEFSKELCGGTHVTKTDSIATLEILTEESVSSGTRRIVALTGVKADEHREKLKSLAKETAKLLGCTIDKIGAVAQDLVGAVRKLKKMATGAGKRRSTGDDWWWHRCRRIECALYATTKCVSADRSVAQRFV